MTTSVRPGFSVAAQIKPQDLPAIADAGFRSIISHQPDRETSGQPDADMLAIGARRLGLEFVHLPVAGEEMDAAEALAMRASLEHLPEPILAFCCSGDRAEAIYRAAVGSPTAPPKIYDVVIVGGGSAGIACAASLLKRAPDLSLAIVEPSDAHYYQPGWTLVGAGALRAETTRRPMADVIPKEVRWIKKAVTHFHPHRDQVALTGGSALSYRVLVIATGLELDWQAIPGLPESLGRNGVTSNYRYDLASYTNDLVSSLGQGRALFTQPPMPIKCAGAPQKAMYLSCHAWEGTRRLKNIDVQFHTAAPVLFGVPAYVPALEAYIQRYGIDLNYGSRLVEVDGNARLARFEQLADGRQNVVERRFEMLHVVPPQVAPAFVRRSELADTSGFIAADPATLRHPSWPNIFAIGDIAGVPNAKTAAAARKQAPIVAANALAALDGEPPVAIYDGYGSCPLTVERGRIVLAEFGYGGKLLPTFPSWILDGRKPTRAAWLLKHRMLPAIYWHAMLKGREWMAKGGLPNAAVSR